MTDILEDPFAMIPLDDREPKPRAEATSRMIALRWRTVKGDFIYLEKYLAKAEKWKIWEHLGAESLDALVQRDVGVTLEEMRGRIALERKEAGDKERESAKDRPGVGAPKGNQNAAKNNSTISRIESSGKPGPDSKKRLLRRLARLDTANGTDFLGQWERQEFHSVRQAAIAAGIVKVPTSFQLAKRAINRLSDDGRNEFFSWLKKEYGL